jgi:hypothetical protein
MTEVDTDQDRYPAIGQVCNRIANALRSMDTGVEKVEITCFANGDATYRVWAPRSEEPEGGFLPPK